MGSDDLIREAELLGTFDPKMCKLYRSWEHEIQRIEGDPASAHIPAN